MKENVLAPNTWHWNSIAAGQRGLGRHPMIFTMTPTPTPTHPRCIILKHGYGIEPAA